MPKPNDAGVGTAVFILNEKGEILLMLRKGAHRAGHWAVPGGWIDRLDPSTNISAIREVKEETGIEVRRLHHVGWTSEDHPKLGVRSISLYHVALPGEWEGDPRIMEPHKCEELRWFDLQDLPETTFPGLTDAVSTLILWQFERRLVEADREGWSNE